MLGPRPVVRAGRWPPHLTLCCCSICSHHVATCPALPCRAAAVWAPPSPGEASGSHLLSGEFSAASRQGWATSRGPVAGSSLCTLHTQDGMGLLLVWWEGLGRGPRGQDPSTA